VSRLDGLQVRSIQRHTELYFRVMGRLRHHDHLVSGVDRSIEADVLGRSFFEREPEASDPLTGQHRGPPEPADLRAVRAQAFAFAFAIEEAERRGFGPGTHKTVQLLTDGDPDLHRHVDEYFPARPGGDGRRDARPREAVGGRSLWYAEGSPELAA